MIHLSFKRFQLIHIFRKARFLALTKMAKYKFKYTGSFPDNFINFTIYYIFGRSEVNKNTSKSFFVNKILEKFNNKVLLKYVKPKWKYRKKISSLAFPL